MKEGSGSCVMLFCCWLKAQGTAYKEAALNFICWFTLENSHCEATALFWRRSLTKLQLLASHLSCLPSISNIFLECVATSAYITCKWTSQPLLLPFKTLQHIHRLVQIMQSGAWDFLVLCPKDSWQEFIRRTFGSGLLLGNTESKMRTNISPA